MSASGGAVPAFPASRHRRGVPLLARVGLDDMADKRATSCRRQRQRVGRLPPR